MTKKDLKKRIREEMRAEQAEYDERTRQLRERIMRDSKKSQSEERRESS